MKFVEEKNTNDSYLEPKAVSITRNAIRRNILSTRIYLKENS